MNSVNEYKSAIQLGVQVKATIRYFNSDPLTVTGTVVKKQLKEYVISSPEYKNGQRIWLSFPLVRDAQFINGGMEYTTRAGRSRVEILEAK